MTASGLPPIRLHDLRHGTATLGLAAYTALKVVQVMPRHASIVLTADAYVSVLPVVAHEAAWGAGLGGGSVGAARRSGSRP